MEYYACYIQSSIHTVKASTNMSNVKAVMLVWDILELMSFLHQDARSLHFLGKAQQRIQ
jgi:hypothetical protein